MGMSFKIDCKHRHTFLNSASTNEKANSVGVQSTSILPEVNLLYTLYNYNNSCST